VEVPDPVRQHWQQLAAADTPAAALAAARLVREALAAWEAELATEAVATGVTWEALGSALGVSRQAAWERYSRRMAKPAEDAIALRRAQRAALADARARLKAARRATGDARVQLLAEARAQRDDALRLLDRAARDERN
jgi:hypothetical protein